MLCEIEMLISVISLYNHTKVHTVRRIGRQDENYLESRRRRNRPTGLSQYMWRGELHLSPTTRSVGSLGKPTRIRIIQWVWKIRWFNWLTIDGSGVLMWTLQEASKFLTRLHISRLWSFVELLEWQRKQAGCRSKTSSNPFFRICTFNRNAAAAAVVDGVDFTLRPRQGLIRHNTSPTIWRN